MKDTFNGTHSTSSVAALECFSQATHQFLAHGRLTLVKLDDALAADPQMSAALSLRGLLFMLQAKPELRRAAADCLKASQPISSTPFEHSLAKALDCAISDCFEGAACILDSLAETEQGQILAMKLSHQYRFMVGNTAGMLKSSKLYTSEQHGSPGFGYALGCLSFALEELGQYSDARSCGIQALDYHPNDAWAAHSVIHTFEMTSSTHEGLKFIQDHRDRWTECNNFGYHLEWHYGLFLLEQRRIDELLVHYDTQIRPISTDDFRDFANASSMLWRIESAGHSVGWRWEELAEIARPRIDDGQLVFFMLHQILVFVASGDIGSARSVIDRLHRVARDLEGEQVTAAQQVGVPLAELLLDGGASNKFEIPTQKLLENMPLMGGSHAQRDVFLLAMLKTFQSLGIYRDIALIQHHRSLQRPYLREFLA